MGFASGYSGQHLNRLIDAAHGNHMKTACRGGVNHILTQHQVINIGTGNQHALGAGQAAPLTNVEKSFNLVVDRAYRLHLPQLIDRPGHGERLRYRSVRQR